MNKSNINPAIFQQMLESASNAADKGQAQYFTPVPWAQALSQPLPKLRPFILDLQCGNGQLLAGAAKRGSELLGCDIDPGGFNSLSAFIPADVTRLYELMRAVDFHADLIVLNPPWDLHWHRCVPHGPPGSGLSALAESEIPAVRAAFAAKDDRIGRRQIDSTVATLCLALDRLTGPGEGMLIGNEATLQRLILGPGAPHGALATHIWAHVVIEGNICTEGCSREPLGRVPNIPNGTQPEGMRLPFQTGVIYFAPAHGGRPEERRAATLAEAEAVCRELSDRRIYYRRGQEVREHTLRFTEDTGKLWRAIGEEWAARTSATTHPHYNLWLRPNHTIGANVSLFDTRSGRADKRQAERLFHLADRSPMQLVVMRNDRKELEAAVHPDSPWRVDPALQAAVKQAVAEYELERAPLYPLNPIMRLGYLDEHETILCERILGRNFTAGRRYPLRSQTVQVTRAGTKINNSGMPDDVEYSGQELAFYIRDNAGVERIFMDAQFREENIRVNLLNDRKEDGDKVKIDFTLQYLVEHFHIPEVPDVATLHPDAYQRNLRLLDEIEALVNE
ncbi:MAG: hypothetical protein ACTHLW_21800 [Verrucomicrobiota bacterium]